MPTPSPKRKSQKRFEQFNMLVDKIGATLPTASHFAVLMVCFRHARGDGCFRVSSERIAKSLGIDKRHAVRLMDGLKQSGVIRKIKDHQGPIPVVYQITFRPANDDTGVTIKPR